MASTEKHECAGYLMLREKSHGEDGPLHRASCHGEVDWKVEDKHYCLMHAPIKDKAEKFEKVLQDKLTAMDYNFCGVWFPQDLDFGAYNFVKKVNFNFATFNGGANFSKAQFRGDYADFSAAQFSGGHANFREALFAVKMANFSGAEFSSKETDFFGELGMGGNPDFWSAEFSSGDAYFSKTQFSGGVACFFLGKFSGGNASFRDSIFSGGEANFGAVEFSGGDASFSGSQFSGGEANFTNAKFSGGEASFIDAKFSGGDASFINTQFSGGNAYFREALFTGGNTNFRETQFTGNVFFDEAKFSGEYTSFRQAKFDKTVYFNGVVFAKNVIFANAEFGRQTFFDKALIKKDAYIYFGLAFFKDLTRFKTLSIEEGAELYFGEATFEKPERVYFHSLPNLQPRWFINADVRKYNFEYIKFRELRGRNAVASQLETAQNLLTRLREQEGEREGEVPTASEPPYKLLAIACRRLAENAEDNNRYEEAMNLRYMAMDIHRRSDWWRRFLPVDIHWWYWASSGYGERALRAAVMLFLIWLIPFLFYASPTSTFHRAVNDKDIVLGYVTSNADGKTPEMADMPALSAIRENNLRDAAFYSLNVMAFQKPEPKPANDSWPTRLIVILQTILGPVQATLLLLAIRRKFMR